jgi:ATP-dependent protease HslVU (ClpYQ) ATPase subunit
VILLVLLGGALQASWIGKVHTGFEDRLRELNEESARFLRGRKEETVKQMVSNEARVQNFLIRRDPTGAGLKDTEQSVYQKELHPRRGLDKARTDDENIPESGQTGVDILESTEASDN